VAELIQNASSPTGRSGSSARRFRIVPRFETYPHVVAFVATPAGKLVVLAVFAAGYLLHGKDWWLDATFLLGAMTFLPQYRRLLVLIGSLYWLVSSITNMRWELVTDVAAQEGLELDSERPVFRWAIYAAVLLFSLGIYQVARTFPNRWPMRRPIAGLLLLYLGMLFAAWHLPLNGYPRVVSWAFVIVFGHYIWFLGYALLARKSSAVAGIGWQLGFFQPFWMAPGGYVPYGKGAAYLGKIEAKNSAELAVCQIKALKLLYWAGGWAVVREFFRALVYGDIRPLPNFLGLSSSLNLPSLLEAVQGSVHGVPFPAYVSWLAVVFGFLYVLLKLTIFGHVVIATCRMAGFNALRNTYNPLGSKTIAEFWNRYYYYFKELLVEFFFYGTFLRYFKKYPRIRLFFATLSAAGFGNFVYHYFRDIGYIVEMGPWGAFLNFHVYLFYGLLLGTGIGLSQIYIQGRPGTPETLGKRLRAPFVVGGFFCFVSIFGDPDRSLTLLDYFSFLSTLVGLR